MTLDSNHQQQRLQQFLHQELRHAHQDPPFRQTNNVSDIPGAQPLLKNHLFINKPHFYDPHDIRGSVSKELHPSNRRVGDDDRFKQLPIEGSNPRPSGFKTNRVCNPLSPEYKLPTFTSAPLVTPVFLRDSYNVTDIEGTSFKKKIITHPRDPMKLDDLPGSQAGWLPRNKRGLREHPPRDIINVQDITNVDFKSSRITNVLDPVYTVNGMIYQDDQYCHPQPQHPLKNKPAYALLTSDIAGASCSDPATTVVAGITNGMRRDFRVTNCTEDIRGAKADTHLHSIRSNRRVNPNDPQYVALDGNKVDSSAVSVGKSIVFADLIHDHEYSEMVWAKQHEQDNGAVKYTVSSIGNIGNVGNSGAPLRRRSSLPTQTGGRGTPVQSTMNAGEVKNNNGSSARLTPSEKKQAESRREEIQLVRQLS